MLRFNFVKKILKVILSIELILNRYKIIKFAFFNNMFLREKICFFAFKNYCLNLHLKNEY